MEGTEAAAAVAAEQGEAEQEGAAAEGAEAGAEVVEEERPGGRPRRLAILAGRPG